jgi:trimeric autotransporter adhesin
MLSFRRASLMVAAAGCLTAGGPGATCVAQCTGSWDTTIGQPGIGSGYVAPIRAWNDGTGERIYVGGSFTSVGGSGAGRYLAAWDPATGVWSPLGSGISGGFTNAFMTSLVPFTVGGSERLVAGGFFDTAGGVPQTASVAMWNGSSWASMGTGWTGSTRGSIWSMAVFNGRLYVGGGIVNTDPGTGQAYPIGGQTWAGVASWDGAAWQSHVSTIAGFSPYVGALAVFDAGSGPALYAGGRFNSLDGVPGTALLARWNGETWSSVGGGLTATSSLFGLEGLIVFDEGSGPGLYAAGYAFIPSGQGACNVARWNGSTWACLGGQLGTGRLTSIASFDDGAGAKLYIGGTAMPQINYLARWESQQWMIVDGGITGPGLGSNFPSVFGLGVAGGRLYVGGSFTEVNGMAANGLAARTPCTPVCYANCDGSTTAPILNVEDFTCFINEFAAAIQLPHEQQLTHYANCDESTTAPVLNVEDFTCFINKFAQGCP